MPDARALRRATPPACLPTCPLPSSFGCPGDATQLPRPLLHSSSPSSSPPALSLAHPSAITTAAVFLVGHRRSSSLIRRLPSVPEPANHPYGSAVSSCPFSPSPFAFLCTTMTTPSSAAPAAATARRRRGHSHVGLIPSASPCSAHHQEAIAPSRSPRRAPQHHSQPRPNSGRR